MYNDQCILSCEIITIPVIWSEIYILYEFSTIFDPLNKKKFELKKFE